MFYQLAHRCARLLIRTVARAHVERADLLDQPPPYILATNHLTSWDPPLIFAFSSPRVRVTVLAADKWRKVPPILVLFNLMGAIWVKRGEVDRAALRKCVKVLQSGGVIGMSPEGTRSRTGGLIRGRPGVAYLARKAGVPILPVALWGVEQIGPSLRRLRRANVYLRVGEFIHLPPGPTHTEQLEADTERIMRTIAAMLPERYRGVYR
ncbi:MAG: lysophospholipid acyltransferase family protein [Anaerolineae bacterium]|nr:1-acyl-sn-glycerol-3-phosphate acyltransferase [Thermoflexales bacterium]MDW8408270.1 lysophospholipid acyltransferase family protein [Anaerolineae bacterium]